MSLQRRVARLEQAGVGNEGAGIWGLMYGHHLTGAGPDVVTVGPTGETLTQAGFAARYPRGILILLPYLQRDAPTGDAGDPGNAVPTRFGSWPRCGRSSRSRCR